MLRLAEDLRWSEVDPATHPFDPERVAAIVRRALEGHEPPRFDGTAPVSPDAWVRAQEDRIDRALAAEHGL